MRRIKMRITKIKLIITILICLVLNVFYTINVFAQGDDIQEEKPIITKIIEKEREENKDIEIRYPNKLNAKEPPKDSNINNKENIGGNKGIPSTPSNSKATLIENFDNTNRKYPIYHGSNGEQTDKYSADARQFVSFKTKSGKTFHLIINHDEKGENVMLLTEVSEDDLLNMVEIKEKQKEVVKVEPVKQEVKEEVKQEKDNQKSDTGTYLLLIAVVSGVLGAGYYFKVLKKKEEKELEKFEEDDDEDFFSESNSNGENESPEVENSEDKDTTDENNEITTDDIEDDELN